MHSKISLMIWRESRQETRKTWKNPDLNALIMNEIVP
jgi:hypothetical protein